MKYVLIVVSILLLSCSIPRIFRIDSNFNGDFSNKNPSYDMVGDAISKFTITFQDRPFSSLVLHLYDTDGSYLSHESITLKQFVYDGFQFSIIDIYKLDEKELSKTEYAKENPDTWKNRFKVKEYVVEYFVPMNEWEKIEEKDEYSAKIVLDINGQEVVFNIKSEN